MMLFRFIRTGFLPRLLGSALCLALLGLSGGAAVAAERNPVARAAGPQEAAGGARVIVKYRAGAELLREQAAAAGRGQPRPRPQFAARMSQRLGITLSDGRVLGDRSQVLLAAGISSTELARRLAADSDVEYAEPSLRRFPAFLPDDPLYPSGLTTATPAVGQWYLREPRGTAKSAIDVHSAWSTTRGSRDIVVAVLDTGVRSEHPDLARKLYTGYDFISDAAVANDGNGRDRSAADPGDWLTQADINGNADFAGCTAEDSSWHGTQTAGLVGAATDNGIGMAGVAPKVMLLPVRVLGRCGGADDDIIAAMLWAGGVTDIPVANAHPARVISMSLSAQGACGAAYADAVAQLNAAGVVVVAAAGNEGVSPGAPANCSGVISVAALRHIGTKVGYSNFGAGVSISAPGGNCVNTGANDPCLFPILTTSNTGTRGPAASTYTDGGASASLGTSFSTPLVAGTAALMLSVDPSLTPSALLAKMRSTARAFPRTGAAADVAACGRTNVTDDGECYCTTATCGAGMLDAGAAVRAVAASVVAAAVITSPAATVDAGTSLVLDASHSSASLGETVTAYAWSVVDGASSAHFSGAANTRQATLTAVSPGTVTVRLVITDSAGQRAAARLRLSVQ